MHVPTAKYRHRLFNVEALAGKHNFLNEILNANGSESKIGIYSLGLSTATHTNMLPKSKPIQFVISFHNKKITLLIKKKTIELRNRDVRKNTVDI